MSKKSYKKGEIVIVPFPFTDLSGQKIRPALVLGKNVDKDLIICFISSQISKVQDTEIKIIANSTNKLKQDSKIICSKITTLDKKVILGKIGEVENQTMKAVDQNLRKLFGL